MTRPSTGTEAVTAIDMNYREEFTELVWRLLDSELSNIEFTQLTTELTDTAPLRELFCQVVETHSLIYRCCVSSPPFSANFPES